jgi:hypothetical protein
MRRTVSVFPFEECNGGDAVADLPCHGISAYVYFRYRQLPSVTYLRYLFLVLQVNTFIISYVYH